MEPRPFTINVPDEVLADLKDRLGRVRWPDEVPGAGWAYGTDLAYIQQLVAYWRDTYDWRANEARLNAFQQFTVPIADIDLHVIHQPGVGPNPLPLLISHGWPGSIVEFTKLIPMLTDPARFGGDPADAFTVVAPSLPGYGFSFTPNQPRFSAPRIAEVFAEVMTRVLGYERFAAHGGDWGSFITARLGHAFPQHLFGIHLTMLPIRRDLPRPAQPTDEEARYLEELAEFMREESAYQMIQGTRPQTLAYGLTDSPAGLAAWIVEKFRTWSDCDGDVESVFTRDEILTNVMLYWVTGAIGSSFWPYYARLHEGWPIPDQRIETPTAYLAFPREIYRPPRSLAEPHFNIQRWTPAARGGHFAGLEQPETLAHDLREFFRPFRGN